MRKLVVLLASAALMATAACNTIKGMGQDTAAAGTAVSQTAQDAQN